MSVIVKGMKMPKNCDECDFVQRGFDDWCYLTTVDVPEELQRDAETRPEFCPLEEVEE